jgi:hypothetical protein
MTGPYGPNRPEQFAEKFFEESILEGSVTGHDFSRAKKPNKINVGL